MQSIYQSYSYTMYVEVIGSCIILFTLCHSYPVCMLFGVAPYLIYIFNSWLQKFPRNQRGDRGLPLGSIGVREPQTVLDSFK